MEFVRDRHRKLPVPQVHLSPFEREWRLGLDRVVEKAGVDLVCRCRNRLRVNHAADSVNVGIVSASKASATVRIHNVALGDNIQHLLISCLRDHWLM